MPDRLCTVCARPLEGKQRKYCCRTCAAQPRSDTQTEKQPLQSRYGGWVDPQMYLAEVLCERKARALGKTLPVRFWVSAEWRPYFSHQLHLIRRLSRLYSLEAVKRVLKSVQFKQVYSLAPTWVEKAVMMTQRVVASEPPRRVVPTTPIPPPPAAPCRPPEAFVPKQSALSKLRDL